MIAVELHSVSPTQLWDALPHTLQLLSPSWKNRPDSRKAQTSDRSSRSASLCSATLPPLETNIEQIVSFPRGQEDGRNDTEILQLLYQPLAVFSQP